MGNMVSHPAMIYVVANMLKLYFQKANLMSIEIF